MLKYFKDDYTDGREPIDTGLLEEILRETLKITSDVDVDKVNLRKTILLLFAGINYYFYLHPEQYVDFGKFVAYRSIDMKNLWTAEVKNNETAESIYTWLRDGGLEIDEVQKLVKDYTSDLLDYSATRIDELEDELEDLESLVSQDGDDSNNKNIRRN